MKNVDLPEGAKEIEEVLGDIPRNGRKRKSSSNSSKRRKKKELYDQIKETEELVEKRKDRLKAARRANNHFKNIAKAADSDKPTAIEYNEETEELIEAAIEGKEVAFRANPGPQTDFLKSSEDEILFSGGRGSGKSFAMLMHPFQDFSNPNFRGLIIRNAMPQLRSLIRDAKQLYFKLIPGARWKEKDSMFVFPSGATMEFGYCDSLDDASRYVGQQYSWMGFDEITHFPTEEIFETITLSLRTSDPKLKTRVVCTTNPTGVGVRWVMERWVKLGPPGKKITLTFIENEGEPNERTYTTTRKWFNSNIDDNPFLDSKYKSKLKNIKDPKRKAQWLDGDWGAAIEGIAFPEWDRKIHTCEPFRIPRHWQRFRAMDWGYSSMGVCLWFAVDPQELILYVYRERVYQYLNAVQIAEDIKSCQENDPVKYGYLDASVWAKRGEMGDTPADTMMKLGVSWSPAQNDKGRRVKDKNLLHQYLQEDDTIGKPKLIIFNTCEEIINEMEALPTDAKNPEDVDTNAVDHAYDALRYGVQSNPLAVTSYDEMFSRIEYQRPDPVDVTIGY